MHRVLFRPWRGAVSAAPFRPRTIPLVLQARLDSTTSSPKEAEQASAESGGSRSKDAAAAPEADMAGSSLSDALAEGSARGRTGGGKPLSTSKNAPPQPKILNAAVAGDAENLTEEQKEEVRKHNEDFEKKHDRAAQASDDKVNKKFWSGEGTR